MKNIKSYLSYLLILISTFILTVSCQREEPQRNTQPEVYMKFFGRAFDEHLVEAFPLSNDEILLLGTEYIDDQPNSMFLVRTDQYGNYLWQARLSEVGDGVAASDLILDGDQILVMGHAVTDNTSDLLLWTLDMQGQSLDTMYFGNTNQNERNGHFLINNDSSGYTVITEVWENDQLVGNILGNLDPSSSEIGGVWDVNQLDQLKAKTVIGIERLPRGEVLWIGANNDVEEGDTNVTVNIVNAGGIESVAIELGADNNALDRVRGIYQMGGRLILAGASNASGQMRGHLIGLGLSGGQVALYDTITTTKDIDFELVGYDEVGNGNVVVCGYQMTGSEDMDQYLAEWDSNGNIIWEEEEVLDNPFGDIDMAHRVKVGSDYLLLFGETGRVNNQDISLMRTRLNGLMY